MRRSDKIQKFRLLPEEGHKMIETRKTFAKLTNELLSSCHGYNFCPSLMFSLDCNTNFVLAKFWTSVGGHLRTKAVILR